MKYLLSALFWCVATLAHAEQFDVMLGGGALICDKPESVVTALQTNVAPNDCGVFQTRTGAPVTVTIIGEYEGKPLTMFEFHNPTPWGNQVQYGWWAGELPDNGVDA